MPFPSVVVNKYRSSDMQRLKTFLAAEDGAVTVDFTVLTAVIVVVAVAVAALILAGASDAAASIARRMLGKEPRGYETGMAPSKYSF